MNNEEQDSIIYKIDLLKKYPNIIEICFEEFRSKGPGVMMCIIGILEGSDEPRLNCYFVPKEQINKDIQEKISNAQTMNSIEYLKEDMNSNVCDSLIFYISDTKYSKVEIIKINNLQKYLLKSA